MTVWQTILVYVVIPAAAYGLISVLAAAGKRNKPEPYRPGKPWNHEPVWWTGDPEAAGHGHHGGGHGEHAEHAELTAAANAPKGGASGNW